MDNVCGGYDAEQKGVRAWEDAYCSLVHARGQYLRKEKPVLDVFVEELQAFGELDLGQGEGCGENDTDQIEESVRGDSHVVEAEGVLEPTDRIDEQGILGKVGVRPDGVFWRVLPGLLAEKSRQEVQRFPEVEHFVAVGDDRVDSGMETGQQERRVEHVL